MFDAMQKRMIRFARFVFRALSAILSDGRGCSYPAGYNGHLCSGGWCEYSASGQKGGTERGLKTSGGSDDGHGIPIGEKAILFAYGFPVGVQYTLSACQS